MYIENSLRSGLVLKTVASPGKTLTDEYEDLISLLLQGVDSDDDCYLSVELTASLMMTLREKGRNGVLNDVFKGLTGYDDFDVLESELGLYADYLVKRLFNLINL